MSDKEIQLAELRKKQRQQSQGRIQHDSNQRLKKIIAKKLTTTFICALSEFETSFGYQLWGHGLPEEEITSTQKANKEKWEQVRTNILNKGNTQVRALTAEMDLHKVEFCGYQIQFGREQEND